MNDQVKQMLNNGKFDRGYQYTWRQAGVWAYSIINGFKPYSVLKKNTFVARRLQCIGMTNLKKTGGGATANRSKISQSAKADVGLWKRELEIMNPDLVICGGTYRDIVNNLNLKSLMVSETIEPKIITRYGKRITIKWRS